MDLKYFLPFYQTYNIFNLQLDFDIILCYLLIKYMIEYKQSRRKKFLYKGVGCWYGIFCLLQEPIVFFSRKVQKDGHHTLQLFHVARELSNKIVLEVGKFNRTPGAQSNEHVALILSGFALLFYHMLQIPVFHWSVEALRYSSIGFKFYISTSVVSFKRKNHFVEICSPMNCQSDNEIGKIVQPFSFFF